MAEDSHIRSEWSEHTISGSESILSFEKYPESPPSNPSAPFCRPSKSPERISKRYTPTNKIKRLYMQERVKKQRVSQVSSATEDDSYWDDLSSMDRHILKRSKRIAKQRSRKNVGVVQRMANQIYEQVCGGICYLGSPLISIFIIIATTFIVIYLVYVALLSFISSSLGFAGPTLFASTNLISSSVISLLPRLGFNAAFGAICTITGFGCIQDFNPVQLEDMQEEAFKSAKIARTIFDYLIIMNDKDFAGTNLQQASLGQLAVAVQHSSEWTDKKEIASLLGEMGNAARDLHTEVVELNARSIDSLTWIFHQFTLLEDTLIQREDNPNSISSIDLQKLIEGFYNNTFYGLSTLSSSIDKLFIPIDKGHFQVPIVMGLLTKGKDNTTRAKLEKSVIQQIIGRNAWESYQLENDMQLAKAGLASVWETYTTMETARFSLIAYQRHVLGLRSGLHGFYLASYFLRPEDKIKALTRLMTEFRKGLAEATEKSTSPVE